MPKKSQAPAFNPDEIDITKVFSVGHDDVQKFAQQLKEQGGEENQQLAEALEQVPASVFEMTAAQKRLDELVKLLNKQGYSPANVGQILQSVFQGVTQYISQKITGQMSDEVKALWAQYLANDPNIIQQIDMLDYIYKSYTKKDLNDLLEEALDTAVSDLITSLTRTASLSQHISNLKPEEVERVNKAFADGEYHQAMELIYKSQK